MRKFRKGLEIPNFENRKSKLFEPFRKPYVFRQIFKRKAPPSENGLDVSDY